MTGNPVFDKLCDDAVNLMADLRQQRETLAAALRECEAYFEQRADAEYFPDCATPTGNEEMTLLCLVRDALRRAK
jgi:hypothetical protein